MEHFSRSNVKKLTSFWLTLEDEMKKKALAETMDELLSCQNKIHGLVQPVIEVCEEKRDSEKPKEGSSHRG